MYYRLPQSLDGEIAELERHIGQYQAGALDAASLKARRVPFGCYEQRRDGSFMVRVRATGGAVTPGQLRLLAEVAQAHGGSSLHITTRQEFQLHDLALDQVIPVLRALAPAGLSSRGGGGNTVRNIMVSPEAGVGPDEVFDPSPHAFALTERLIAESDSWSLPRKLKLAFSSSASDSARGRFNDLGFIATLKDGQRGFRVLAAGGLGGKAAIGQELEPFIPEADVYLVATAIKRLFDRHGNRKNRNTARLRFLWRSLGEEGFRALYRQELAAVRALNPAPLELPLLAEATPLEPIAGLPESEPAFWRWHRRQVEPQRQAGRYSVLIPVQLGNLPLAAALALADFLEPLGPDTVRASLGQNLRLRNLPAAQLPALWRLLQRVLPESYSWPRLVANAIACTGADTCKLGICRPKGALSALQAELLRSGLDLDAIPEFQLSLSGCPNSCGQHPLADLGLFGNGGRHQGALYPAYAVTAGARTVGEEARFGLSFGRVPAKALPRLVVEVLQGWLIHQGAHASFADYIDGEGAEAVRAAVARHAEVPSSEQAPGFYQDWGADEPFSLVGRSEGECAAGLFDLIDLDLAAARQLRQGLIAGELADDQLYPLALRTAHALLVTRAIEAGSDEAVFDGFSRGFIGAGLIDERFEPVIAAARRQDLPALGAQRERLFALLDAVEGVYRDLGSSLRL